MTNPIPLNERGAKSTTTGALFGAIFAAALAAGAFVNVCSARTDGTAGADGDAMESLPPAATIERSGSLAVYPLLY